METGDEAGYSEILSREGCCLDVAEEALHDKKDFDG
jgi:hypothetical protein